MSTLFKYFNRTKAEGSSLPDPSGPLSEKVPATSIEEANKEVEASRNSNGGKRRREPYVIVTPEQKARVGKYAAENGTTNAIRRFSKDMPNLKESTIRGWKTVYLCELTSKLKAGDEDTAVERLPVKPKGRPLLLGPELDRQVQDYLISLREAGGVVNTSIAIAAATGIVRRHDSNLLAVNGGHIILTKHWAQYLLQRMGYVKRKASSKVKITVENLASLKEQYLFDIRGVVDMEEIPHDLIINWDQTAVHYVPVSNWTMAMEGSEKVPIAGIDDKRQITLVLAATMSGKLLPCQVVYQGKTKACLPSVTFPGDWDVTFSPNHWCNELTMEHYIQNIITPYVKDTRKKLKLDVNHRALCIFDNFKAQCTDRILQLLENNNIDTVFVPPNCTGELQPLDLSVNKSVKDFLRSKFQEWYSSEVFRSYQASSSQIEPVKFPMSQMKPLGAQWLMDLYDHLLAHPDIIKNGFKDAGIFDIFNS